MQVSAGAKGQLGQGEAWLPLFLGSCHGRHSQTTRPPVPTTPRLAKVTVGRVERAAYVILASGVGHCERIFFLGSPSLRPARGRRGWLLGPGRLCRPRARTRGRPLPASLSHRPAGDRPTSRQPEREASRCPADADAALRSAGPRGPQLPQCRARPGGRGGGRGRGADGAGATGRLGPRPPPRFYASRAPGNPRPDSRRPLGWLLAARPWPFAVRRTARPVRIRLIRSVRLH